MTDGFAIIPNWLIRDTEVSVYALAAYAVLSSRANKAGVSWPSMSTIAREARCSVNTAKKAIEDLREIGLLSWETRREGQKNLSNLYRLNLSLVIPEGVGQEMTHPPSGDDPGVGQEMTQGGSPDGEEEESFKKTQFKKTQLTRTGASELAGVEESSLDSVFDEVWLHWPKRAEKKLSRERFGRALKKHPTLANDIVRFGDAYAATTPTQFVPALAVWIGRERWTDDLPAVRGNGKLSPTDRALQTLALAGEQLEIPA